MSVPPATSPTSQDAQADAIAAAALEEVQFLCRQRMDAIRSCDFTEPELARFDERLAANVDVLLVRGAPAIEWLSTILPTTETAADACGIALVLLQSRDPRAAQALLAALEAAEAEPLRQGLQAALRRGSPDRIAELLRKWFAAGSARQAAAAAEALAFQGQLDASSPRLAQLQSDADPLVRRAAWRATAHAG